MNPPFLFCEESVGADHVRRGVAPAPLQFELRHDSCNQGDRVGHQLSDGEREDPGVLGMGEVVGGPGHR
jgi:hypothetical protein